MKTTFIAYFCIIACFATAAPGSRIIGGQDAAAGRFPYTAAIHVQTADSRFFCGGTLIERQWIITSAHCALNATLFTIQLGSNTLTSPDPDRITVSSSEYIIYPDFDPDRILHDLALIKLRLPVTLNDYIQPAYLASLETRNDTVATAVGWGQKHDSNPDLSETLQFVTLNILSTEECRQFYGSQITDTMACVSGNFNEGSCVGDNGSPLVEVLARYSWLVGVASFISQDGCESTYPSGYTRIYPYTSWIVETIYGQL